MPVHHSDAGRWHDLAAVAGSDGRLYALGGYNGGALHMVEAYTPGINGWSSVAPLPTARYGLAAGEPVQAHWGAVSGPLLGSGSSTLLGTAVITFAVPAAPLGR